MEPITWLKDLIRNAEERERLLYAGVFFVLLSFYYPLLAASL